jgi:hypothetical protein
MVNITSCASLSSMNSCGEVVTKALPVYLTSPCLHPPPREQPSVKDTEERGRIR